MCPTEHPVLTGGKPIILVLSDQNFPTNLSGGGGNCVPVARLEDASLSDLAALLNELLEKTKPVAGSVVLIGSGSHLVRVGACAYAFDWCELVAGCRANWPNISVCPLVPIMTCDFPGNASRDIAQLAVWYHEVYQNLPNGLLSCWIEIVRVTDSNVRGSTRLDSVETQKMPMPNSLDSLRPATFVFEYDHTCPVLLVQMDRKAIHRVVTCIIDSLRTNFSVPICPEKILCKAASEGNAPSSISKAIVVGASIMKQTVPFLKDCGLEVTDLSRGGWVASPTSVTEMEAKLGESHADRNTVVILDLFGNSTYRFIQEDGTLALPVKMGGKYHLPGPVKLISADGLKKAFNTVKPILEAVPSSPKIILPPPPRYIGTGCCDQETHCSNCRSSEFAQGQLDELISLRKCLKDLLLASGIQNFWVLDGVGVLSGFSDPKDGKRPSKAELLAGVRVSMAKDGVHLTEVGQKNLALAISSAAIRIQERQAGSDYSILADSVSAQSKQHHWRGFTSLRGASSSHSLGSGSGRSGHSRAGHSRAGRGGAGHSGARNRYRSHPYLQKKP